MKRSEISNLILTLITDINKTSGSILPFMVSEPLWGLSEQLMSEYHAYDLEKE